MEYTINKLAKLAGVSARTLRYYDECGLLKPKVIRSNGYRIYGETEVDRLQQILFYRELGVELAEIGRILASNSFDGRQALESHLAALKSRREQLDRLIANVEKSIRSMKGELNMTDEEKFVGFKQKLIDDNEKQYGEEIRAKYGDDMVNLSNAKLKGATKEQYAEMERLAAELNDTLKAAFEQGDPASGLAQKVAELHKRWLCFYWDNYTKEAHLGVAQMYVDDPRFMAYYDKIAPGCAVFLRDAVKIHCGGE
ncbi:MAG: MerR family transcriptional regulator [Clostridiales bacterium]|jgi:DNA-binding transcriptional MerR regulator|nr:MerR family transcriptional regulator [Clostridiales bacterium]